MIEIKCGNVGNALQLTEMTPFQGGLKRRTTEDIEALKESLETEGLLMPFAVWQTQDRCYILDGHGRYEALVRLALKDATVLTQQFPTLFISAETEDEARQALLQITSTYGKVTKKGLITFTASIPDYKAPIVQYIQRKVITKTAEPTANDTMLVRLKMQKDMAPQFLEIIKDLKWIEVY
jgi:hypothetical protein